MKSQLKSYDLNRLLVSASRHLGKEIDHDCQRRSIHLGEGATKAFFCAYDFEDGVQMFLVDGVMPEFWEILQESSTASPFLLYFCVRGNVEFSYGTAAPMVMEPLKTFMVAHSPGQPQKLILRQGAYTTFVCIKLERRLYINHIGCLPELVQSELGSIFSGDTTIKTFLNSDYGLKGAVIVQQIVDDKKDGLIHCTFAESKAIELFSLQLRRWETEILKVPSKSALLRPDDMEKIILARNLLISDLRSAPTIEVLSKKSGVNRQKLKQGFKKMFGATINEYVRNERLRLAQQLFTSGNVVVKEVASAVGYENASYFARRYKEKFGLYPNEYLQAGLPHQEEE